MVSPSQHGMGFWDVLHLRQPILSVAGKLGKCGYGPGGSKPTHPFPLLHGRLASQTGLPPGLTGTPGGRVFCFTPSLSKPRQYDWCQSSSQYNDICMTEGEWGTKDPAAIRGDCNSGRACVCVTHTFLLSNEWGHGCFPSFKAIAKSTATEHVAREGGKCCLELVSYLKSKSRAS